MNSYLIVFYQDEKSIFEWLTDKIKIPTFRVGESLWFEVSSYPTWQYEEPKTMRLTEFRITSISHSLLRTYGNEIITSYKMEVGVQEVIE